MGPSIATVLLYIMDLLKEVLDMARKQYTAEQIIGKLREVEVLLSQGKTQEQAIRAIGVTGNAYYRWRKE